MKFSAKTLWIAFVALTLLFGGMHASAQRRVPELWQAAFDGDLEGVKRAAAHGDSVNAQGRGGFSALLAAARNGHLAVVQYLVDHGADINKRDNNRDKTPLTAAAFKGHADIIEYLLQHGAEINDQSINKLTALHDAAYIGCFECVKALVDHKADLHIRNERGESAAETARRGETDAVKRGQTNASPEDYRRVIEYIREHGG